jgi:hypothetical protein
MRQAISLGDHRVNPRPWQPNYLVLRSLAATVKREIAAVDRQLDVVDVGCGTRPYEPLFRGRTRTYV